MGVDSGSLRRSVTFPDSAMAVSDGPHLKHCHLFLTLYTSESTQFYHPVDVMAYAFQ